MPEPVGAEIRTCSPEAIAGQACSWAAVGAANARVNQSRVAGLKPSSAEIPAWVATYGEASGVPRPSGPLTCGALLTRRRTYPRWLVRGLVLFAVGMTALAAVASREHHSSVSARNQVLSQYVALEARVVQSSDPALARQLSFTAYRIAQSMAARSALLDINSGVMPARLFAQLGPAYTPADPAAGA